MRRCLFGKTSRWHDPGDRFANVETAYEQACSIALEYEMTVQAIYHSRSSDHIKESPLLSVPLRLKDKIIYIIDVWGGELLFRGCAYRHNQKGEWLECEFSKLTLDEINPKINPRRILSRWNNTWGVLDYGNNHETELKRLYGSINEN